jgi:hypothetical protein
MGSLKKITRSSTFTSSHAIVSKVFLSSVDISFSLPSNFNKTSSAHSVASVAIGAGFASK